MKGSPTDLSGDRPHLNHTGLGSRHDVVDDPALLDRSLPVAKAKAELDRLTGASPEHL
jgi:hypothetical protein